MRGKPLLVAAATFLIVLIGGAALAGVGSLGSGTGSADLGAAPEIALPDLDLPAGDEPTTTTEAKPAATTTTVDVPEAKAEVAAEAVDGTPATKDADPEGDEEAKHESDEPVKLFTITKPADGSRVTTQTVTFGGEVADDTIVTRGKYTADQSNGTWSLTLVLSPGKNRVGFAAIGPEGAVQELTVTIYYDAPSDEKEKDSEETEKKKDKEEAPDYHFKAKQKYGSCGEDVPYDVFYGKGKPGSTISVTSPYGSNSTTVGEGGHWEVTVSFPSAPPGEKFTVTVKASTGETKSFTFVNTGGEHGKDH